MFAQLNVEIIVYCVVVVVYSIFFVILMLEDIGEPAYKIHRMLTQLRLGGLLSQCKAIVLGTFERCTAPESCTLNDVIMDALAGINTPVYYNAKFGHGPDNHIWNAGREYILDKEKLYVA